MGPTSETKVKENTWYVAIHDGFGGYSPFTGAGGESYRDFANIAKKHGMEIVAERFDINDTTINRLTGFDEQGKRIQGDSPLITLVKKLGADEKIDPQVALNELCGAA